MARQQDDNPLGHANGSALTGGGIGPIIGGVLGGPMGAAAGAIAGGGSGGILDTLSGGIQDRKMAEGEQTIHGLRDKEHTDNTGILGGMKDNDSAYSGKVHGLATDAKTDISHYQQRGDAALQGAVDERGEALTNSRVQYGSTVEPKQKQIMETAGKRAGEAMTLKDRMDPNNSVHRANEAKYNTQADNEGRAGLADAGVLQALGAQNAATQLGSAGVPMTGGQMSAIYGSNQNAAGAAYAATQRRMQALRDQGIEKGYSENDKIYNEGVDAAANYAGRVKDYQQGGVNARAEQGDIAREKTGYGIDEMNLDTNAMQKRLALDTGDAGIQHQMTNAPLTRDLAESHRDTSGRIEDAAGGIKRAQGDKETQIKAEAGILAAAAGGAGGGGGGVGGLLSSLAGAGAGAGGLGAGGGDQTGADQPQQGTTDDTTGNANPEDVNGVEQGMQERPAQDMSPESLDSGGGSVAGGGSPGGDQNGGYYQASGKGAGGQQNGEPPPEDDTTAGMNLTGDDFGMLGRDPYAQRRRA